MKILSISNSFGVNLQTYASQIAKANGYFLDIYVLYIGGCTLEKHVENLKDNLPAYDLYHNGKCERNNVTISEMIKSQEWDYILTQQVSYLGTQIETFYPFITTILQYLKNNSQYKFLGLQETWEYSSLFKKNDGNFFAKEESLEMYVKLKETYEKVAENEGIFLINSGEVIHKANEFFNKEFQCNDGFHLSNEGCYLIGLNLFKKLFKAKLKNAYVTNDINISDIENYIDFINNLE